MSQKNEIIQTLMTNQEHLQNQIELCKAEVVQLKE